MHVMDCKGIFKLVKNLLAAFQGPSVWELDGPMPIFNISKTDIISI
jgi:hypothetical protein